VDPLTNRVGQLENSAKETEKSIGNLEQGVSRADERARGAESRASQAAEAAQQANDRAVKSGEQADAAARAAAGAAGQAEQVGQRASAQASALDNRISSLDNYSMVAEGSVLFDSGKSELNDAAKQSLDEMAAKVQPFKRFVVEIQGFTDQVGAPDYNLELSRQRASSVQRYLIMQHKVPLYRISILGAGEDAPVADNKTRDGRKQNRRVEVKVYTADEALTGKKVEARLGGQ
jgi:outer membrane protein OmpA-like peptidoglycan-associated protein